MNFLTRSCRRPLQIQALSKARDGASSSRLERLVLNHLRCERVGEKRVEGAALGGGNSSRRTKQCPVESDGDVDLGADLPGHEFFRAGAFYRGSHQLDRSGRPRGTGGGTPGGNKASREVFPVVGVNADALAAVTADEPSERNADSN